MIRRTVYEEYADEETPLGVRWMVEVIGVAVGLYLDRADVTGRRYWSGDHGCDVRLALASIVSRRWREVKP
jgi:hypothetical protein